MEIQKFTLNETLYFGEGARKVLPDEIKNRGFKKVLVVTRIWSRLNSSNRRRF